MKRPAARLAVRREVFTDIFARHFARVREHIECAIDDESEASEILSEVFALAWQKLEPATPMALSWLLRAADNKLRDRERHLRAKRMAVYAIVRGARPPQQDILDVLAVRHAIETVLSRREQRMIVLFYWDRLSAGEIASVMQCSQASVFTALSRARSALRERLGSDEQTGDRVLATG